MNVLLLITPLSSQLDRALESMASVKYPSHFMSMSHAPFRFSFTVLEKEEIQHI